MDLNRDAFDPICGFLNRSGGYLILGVRDDGSVKGLHEDKIQGIMNAIVPLENISSGSEDSSEEVRESTRDSVLRLLRKDNKRTAKDLSSAIERGEKVRLDFEGVEVVSNSFEVLNLTYPLY